VIVSVVIPAFNAASFIGPTLDTVCAQTFSDYETIVIDNGSTDNTAAVVRTHFGRHDMRGRIVRVEENCGVAGARNIGIRAATGTYVALLDSDDLWYPEKLAAVMAEFERHPDADLVCHDENITRDGKIVSVSRRRPPRGSLYEALVLDGNFLSPSATTFRRDAALALGGFDERADYLTAEDYDFWIRFSRERRIRFLNRVLGEFVLHERSASRGIVSHHIALERMLRDHLSAYQRSHPGLVSRLRARRRLARVYRSAARQLIAHGEAAGDQQAFVSRMLRTYPLELRNVAVALMWIAGAVRRLSIQAPQA
jgi:glycosyltransferase involved in cell wall biosynthesis